MRYCGGITNLTRSTHEVWKSVRLSCWFIAKKMPEVFDQNEKEPEFDWLQLHSEIRDQVHEETTQEKFMRKLKDNPFVPIGIYTIST